MPPPCALTPREGQAASSTGRRNLPHAIVQAAISREAPTTYMLADFNDAERETLASLLRRARRSLDEQGYRPA